MRPGNISNHKSFKPKRDWFQGRRRHHSNFGAFGKSAMLPPPAPTAGGPAGAIALTDAYNKKTKNYYMQDPKCGIGERMIMCDERTHISAGCKVSECCDATNYLGFCVPDCGPNAPLECDDDADYIEFPEKKWANCEQVIAAFASKGIPGKFAEKFCDEEDILTIAEIKQAKETTARGEAEVQTAKVLAACGPRPRKVCQPNTSLQCFNNRWVCARAQAGASGLVTAPAAKAKPPCQPRACGTPPHNVTCRVPGHGMKPPICHCGKWVCPTGPIMAERAAQKKAGMLAGLPDFGKNKVLYALVAAGVGTALVILLRSKGII